MNLASQPGPPEVGDPAAVRHMQCMEIWGGNEPVDSAVVMPGLDAWIYSRPFGDAGAGGDVHYVSSCATGRITRLLLADVSGHGAVVAQTAQALRRLMQRYVNYIDQTALVRAMNWRFALLSDAGSFATAIVSTFFAPTNDLTLCLAGHPPPLLYRARTGAWSLLREQRSEAGNIPLGVDQVVSDWSQFGVKLEIGDLVLCYTDALIESRGADGQMLGSAGLLKLVARFDAVDASLLLRRLLHDMASLHEGNLSNDDVTILLFRPNGQGKVVRLRDKILAPLRVVGGLLKAAAPSGGAPPPWPEVSLANLGGAMLRRLNRGWSAKNRAAQSDPPAPTA